ncbi:MAG: hypothetical protein C5B51_06995 [Terriglobia bacterium]|nr:MAG: hypothetical protein C5B51_06995 [Terriglobia bacterium]
MIAGATARSREAEHWNRALTSPAPTFNTEPNVFLASMLRDRRPGKALDAGMGQGRNAVFLACQGWEVEGFDPAGDAVALADRRASEAGVRLKTSVHDEVSFPWRRERWDLIVALYVPVRLFAAQILVALKPGGLLVTEGLQISGPDASRMGAGVVFESNELLDIFGSLRILHYEDTLAMADFGPRTGPARIVRLCAERSFSE